MQAAHRRLAGAAALALAALLLAGALVSGAPAGALAAGAPQAALELQGSASLQLACVDVVKLPVATTPDSIETGIPCGMVDMCGQDPCLCGATDEWGACACNGLRQTYPTYALSCDTEGVAGMFELFGTTYLVALGAGSTDAVITASLPHHATAQLNTHIGVTPFGVMDALKLLVALVALAAACAAAFFAVRALVRAAGRAACRMRARWRRARAGQDHRADSLYEKALRQGETPREQDDKGKEARP